jgi:hypothetical protein
MLSHVTEIEKLCAIGTVVADLNRSLIKINNNLENHLVNKLFCNGYLIEI